MKLLKNRVLVVIVALAISLLSFTTMQALTSALVRITNTAEALYIDPDTGKMLRSLSNTIVIGLLPVANVRLETSLKQVVTAGETIHLTHTLFNSGNVPDSYALKLINATDDEADLLNLAVYADKNANGLLDKGEVKLSQVDNVLAGKVRYLVITGKVPDDVKGGMKIRLKLSASSLNKEVKTGRKIAVNIDRLLVASVDEGTGNTKNKTSIRFLTPTASALKLKEMPDFYQKEDFEDAHQYRIEPEEGNESSQRYNAVRDGIYIEIYAEDIEGVARRKRRLEPIKIVMLQSEATGDSLKIAIRETATGSGIYRSIRSIRLSQNNAGKGLNCPSDPAAYQEQQPDYTQDAPECVLRSVLSDTLRITVSAASATTVVDTAVVAKALGRVFDSTTLKVIGGMQVRFMSVDYRPAVSASTGRVLPAQITDSAGQFQFPDLPVGQYCLEVKGHEKRYQFPSLASPRKFSAYNVIDASYGESGFHTSGLFSVTKAKRSLHIDIPVDPVTIEIDQKLALTMQSSHTMVGVGEVMTYTVTVANHTEEVLKGMKLFNVLPQGFRLLDNTVYINNKKVEGAAEVEKGKVYFNLGESKTDEEIVLRFSVRVTAYASVGEAINQASVSAITTKGRQLMSQTAYLKVQIKQAKVLSSEGIIFGKVHFAKSCQYEKNSSTGVLALGGVRLYLADGRYAVTDASGDYTFYSLPPELHTVKIDSLTLPNGASLKVVDTQQAGDPSSYLLDLAQSRFYRADFVLNCLPSSKASQTIVANIKENNNTLPDMDFLTEPGFAAALNHNANKIALPSKASQADKDITKKLPIIERDKMPISKKAVKTITYRQAKKGTWLWPKGEISTDGRFMVVIQGGVKNPVLFVNNKAIPIEKMGEQLKNKNSRAQLLAWYGVDLKEGENNIEIRGKDTRGKLRVLAKTIFKHPSRGVSIKITSLTNIFIADGGKSSLPLKITILDKHGYPAIGDYFVTLESSEGIWEEADLQDATEGHQVKITDGKRVVHLRSSTNTGQVKISARADVLKGEMQITQTAYLRPLFVTGYLNIKATSNGKKKGRAKFFLKGKVFEDKHLTLSFDSAKAYKADNSGFESEIATSLYPLKGEASTYGFEGRSRAKVFAKLEKNRNSVLYGDYSTEAFSLDDLAQTQRALTGAKVHLEQGNTKLQGYAAYERDLRVVEEFRGNGTASNYELNSNRLVAGSEQVELIIRDKNNRGLIVSSERLQRLTDYTLDAFTGYLSFHRVVPSVDDKTNPVFIRVSYNQSSKGKKVLVAGVQLEHKVSETIKAGASYHTDKHPDKGRRVGGVYLQSTLGKDANITVATARMQHNNGEVSGNAYRVTATQRWQNQAVTDLQLARIDKGFSGAGGVSDRQEIKLTHQQQLNPKIKLNLEASQSESLTEVQKSQQVSAKVRTHQGKWLLEGGLRHRGTQSADESKTLDSAMIGVRRGVSVFGKSVHMGLNYEQDIADSSRHYTTLSTGLTVSGNTSVYAKYESGIDLSDSAALDETGKIDRLVLGVKNKLSSNMQAYSEYRSQALGGGSSAETVTGLRGSIPIEKGLSVTPSLEVIKVAKGEGLEDSLAASVSVKDVRDRDNKKFLRAEIRQGETDDFYALEGSYVKRLDEEWSLYAGESLRINKSGQDGVNGSHEFTLGLAQRPRYAGKHNGLYLYQWKQRRGAGGEGDSRTHVVSTQQHYRINEDIALSARMGGKLKTAQLEGQTYRTDTLLIDAKASYAVNDSMDIYAHSGVIGSEHFKERQYSAGLGANMTLDRNLRLGVGYNKIGFNDKDLDADKQNKDGFFVNLILKADETLLDWFNWKTKKRDAVNDADRKAGHIEVPLPKTTVTYQVVESDPLPQKVSKLMSLDKVAETSVIVSPSEPIAKPVTDKKAEKIKINLSASSSFAKGGAILTTTAKMALRVLAKQIKAKEMQLEDIIITGYTDDRGLAEDNFFLSKYRAQAVAFYLAEQGVDRAKMRMLGKGEAEPIESNKTAKGRKLNQRVDIVVRLKRVLATP
jgi:uncharacterized repeat protein (TIGR01451 family)